MADRRSILEGTTKKSSVDEIRRRFDREVDRFSNLETGQTAAMDAPVALSLIACAAAATSADARNLLDIGCGAGNFTLAVLAKLTSCDVTLLDLSRPMLDRAVERVERATPGKVVAVQGDIREVPLAEEAFDVILAGAVLHHLRNDEEWKGVFAKLHAALRPCGSLWIFDMVEHTAPEIRSLMWERYGDYLAGLKDEEYRDYVFAYIAEEDTPRPLLFQTDLLREVGFVDVEILHKNGCFAAFGARKPGPTAMS